MSDAKDYLARMKGQGLDDKPLQTIPDVPTTTDRTLYNFLTSVKTWISNVGGVMITRNKLLDYGAVVLAPDGSLEPPGGKFDPTEPDIPTGLAASGGMTHVLVTWNRPAYKNHDITEVYASSKDDRSSALLVGTSIGSTFDHSIGAAKTVYYWIRFRSKFGVLGTWNDIAGTKAETAIDVEVVLEALTGEITESQLYKDLHTRINLIDDPDFVVNSVSARIKELWKLVFDPTDTGSFAYFKLNDLKVLQDKTKNVIELVNLLATGSKTNDATAATITAMYNDIVKVHTALSTDPDDGVISLVEKVEELISQMDFKAPDGTPITATAYIRGYTSTYIGTDPTLDNPSGTGLLGKIALKADAKTVTNMVASLGLGADGKITGTLAKLPGMPSAPTSIFAFLTDVNNTLVNENLAGSFASSVKQLGVRLDNATGPSSGITLESAMKTSLDAAGNLTGQYTIKIDNNGHISGFGLFSEAAENATPSSMFMVNADRFTIVAPGATKQNTGLAPFSVQTTNTTIGGVYVPAGTYIADAFIKNASIVGAKIANATIDSSKIISLEADKIKTGFLDADLIQAGTLKVDKLYGNGSYGDFKLGAGFIEGIPGAASFTGTYPSNLGGAAGLLVTSNTQTALLVGGTNGRYAAQMGGWAGSSVNGVNPNTRAYLANAGVAGHFEFRYNDIATRYVDFCNQSYAINATGPVSVTGPIGVGGSITVSGASAGTASYQSIAQFFNGTSPATSAYLCNQQQGGLFVHEVSGSQGAFGGVAQAGYFVGFGNHVEMCTTTAAVNLFGGVVVAFTGAHSALIPTTSSPPKVGDIVVDSGYVVHSSINEALTTVGLSSIPNQKGAVGVYSSTSYEVPTAICNTDDPRNPTVKPEYEALINSHNHIVINSVGEGLINVIGENGSMVVGDLIVTSSTPGKGMRQMFGGAADDIIRSYTVAKCRENVAFSSPTEERQIACIYVCG